MLFFQNYWPIKADKFKDQQNFEAKKTSNNTSTNNNSNGNKLLSQLNQAKPILGWSVKLDFRPGYSAFKSQNQGFNTRTSNVNISIIKKNKKIEVDIG